VAVHPHAQPRPQTRPGLGRVRRIRRTSWVLVAATLWLVPGESPAVVNPVTLIQHQIIKPNMLIVFDTSTSMMDAPGELDFNAHEVGQDCDDGDEHCRLVGKPGRCYFSGTGAMGSGVTNDDTSCHNDNECRVGYCSTTAPKSCDKNSDCGSGNTCKGFCSNNNNTACTSDSGCGGGTCRGLCSNAVKTPCTQESDCTAQGAHCTYIPYDVCIASGSQERSKTCALGQNRCRTNAECTAIAGDTCGNASSRMVVAKKVVSSIVSTYYNQINFGLMTFSQQGYFPYYPVTGTVTSPTITRFLDKDVLIAYGCWSKSTGPAATCTLSGQVYTRRSTLNSKYRVKAGGLTHNFADADWCGSRWCALPSNGGTGFYVGSYYTYVEPTAPLDTSSPLIEATYQGKMITRSGVKYIYWEAANDIRNFNNVYGPGHPPNPIGNSGTLTTQCCATCGGRADSQLAPFMDTTDDPAKAKDMADAIIARMDKARLGGLAPNGGTPTGCTLSFESSTEATDTNNAYSYMAKVKASDTLKNCRNNYVLLVTDGAPNGGFDQDCDSTACSAADPKAAGCTCLAVNAAQQLKAAGVRTYVVGFSQSLNDAKVQKTMNNMAKAGGTGSAYLTVREADLRDAVVSAIYDAAQGSYSTSPSSSSSGIQTTTGVTLGTMVLDTRVDFPGWKGQLIAYETSSGTPTVAWSASTVAFNPAVDADFWKKRNVWTSDGTTMVKFDVNQTTGAITNKHQLMTLGLGATDDEAERVARWMLGDPAMKNPAVLGAIINSTPIDVGPPGKSPLPGGGAFHDAHATRPALVYTGSSDGMLHAFFTRAVTAGSKSYLGGQEAFAYIPQTMLPVQAKLFAQGGQLPDPKDHVYGLANSPKVKNLCTSNCDGTSGTPTWKTVLAMAYGFGGTEAFTLDVTDPFDSGGVKTSSAPAPLMWSTQYETASTSAAYDNDLGLTTSVPAFYYGKSASKDDFRLIFGSYYTDTATGNQGKVLINASASTGSVLQSSHITPGTTCSQVFGLMSDVATARNFAATEQTQILAAYFGDTWGNLYRYVPTVGASNYTGTTGTVSTVNAGGCTAPIHYAPAVVQLDRDNASNRPGEVYLVQVTNSALDDETKSYPASKMIIRRDLANGGNVTSDSTFATITLTAGVTGQLCGVTNAAGTSCVETLPAGARPNATPMAVLKKDGSGFILISTWYLPPADACHDGLTYLIIQDYTITTGIKTTFATKLASEPVTSAVFVGGKLMFVKQAGVTDLTTMLPAAVSFSPLVGGGAPGGAEKFRKLGWMEFP
jgi:hypothetical protein